VREKGDGSSTWTIERQRRQSFDPHSVNRRADGELLVRPRFVEDSLVPGLDAGDGGPFETGHVEGAPTPREAGETLGDLVHLSARCVVPGPLESRALHGKGSELGVYRAALADEVMEDGTCPRTPPRR